MLGKINVLLFDQALYSMEHSVNFIIASVLCGLINTCKGRIDGCGRAAGLADNYISFNTHDVVVTSILFIL